MPNVDLDGSQVGGPDTTYFDDVSFTETECELGRPARGLHKQSVYAFTTTDNDEVRHSVSGKQPIEVDA
jgi:hypothetical protein